MAEKIQLHLGCGKRHIPGFIHIDQAAFSHIDYRGPVESLPMFADNTVDLIYASHVLEYFDRIEVREVLAEWRRVLKMGGILRVAVPDFAALVEAYRRFGLDRILGPLYGRMESGGRIIYHKTVYDFDALATVLTANGFAQVQRYDWRETIHRDHDDYSQSYLPHLDKDKGLLISLNVEGTKI
ncbi:MAG: methyltransferase domain-containing protein [Syntrophobacterales bacterium]|nr:methyltransferase domain-containing protein [Syntrophobacterales bacterium]